MFSIKKFVNFSIEQNFSWLILSFIVLSNDVRSLFHKLPLREVYILPMIRHLAYVLTGLSQRTRIASASSSICVLRLFAKSERVCVCVCVYVCVRCMCAFVFSQRIQTKLTIFYFIRSKLDYVINHKRCLGTSTKMVFF